MWSRRGAGPRCCALCALLGALCALLGAGLRPVTAVAAMAASEERRSASPATPCWRREEFVVARECGRCSGFEVKSIPECGPTGFVEKISCAASKRDEYKSCRSAVLEARIFWRFVGSMICVAAACAVLVVWRQRALDRRALEKVRKQIESI
ncbi:LOW QUALITY PROTEIN: protein JTB isoform X2 [Gallus gallus]|uniref:Protein JTB n=1 Tax=Gallus gallus TaxID=9031 RepID=A0A8V1AG95_CHICK|nr:protein JTB isoform X2 [Gallus gallus]XP_040546637.1 protein JTB isoform X2 [Gallus gallus]XP_040546642.1 LOW QUALITY PROTEIN: protein JTB isoform X2 [Gallus gallus]